MANKSFDGKVFRNVDEVKEILPVQNAGVVVVKEKTGLEIRGKILTEKDGNYKKDLELAKTGAQMLRPGKEVEIIMV